MAPYRTAAFVAGPENRLAAAALRPFLTATIGASNPLVLYGPHGSGKSHLALGLAAWWHENFPTKRVACLSAAEFAQGYAGALEDQRLAPWRRELRDADLLVLEDLGQLAEKRGAQLELARLLDMLADREAAVVMTARTLPAQSPMLAAPLRSRLSAALAVGLSWPEQSARRALLEQVAAGRGVSKRTVHCLADAFCASVPTLISALLELELKAQLDGRSIDAQT
ncbi:MAG TPA: DnaA/Hda family protein, partial [Pirellulales bacterium]|nr:DnaA/Hda family protein [Pirellulales bacterium]